MMRFSNLSREKINSAKFIGASWYCCSFDILYYIKQENVKTTFKFMNCLSQLNGAGESERIW